MLFKREFLILCTLLASMLLAWLALIVWPKQYVSEAKLMIRVGRESVSLDPSATTSQTLMLQKTQEEEVNSALDLLRSRRIAERTVDSWRRRTSTTVLCPTDMPCNVTPLSRLLQPAMRFVDTTLPPLLVATGLKEVLSDRELAIMALTKRVEIGAEGVLP